MVGKLTSGAGGGYIAQRMMSVKTEKDALKATLFSNCALCDTPARGSFGPMCRVFI